MPEAGTARPWRNVPFIYVGQSYESKNRGILFAALIAVMVLSACAGMERPGLAESSKEALRERARKSLESLYASAPEAKELRGGSVAILVFPDIFKAGIIVGGFGGNGVLFSPGGEVLGYYNAASASFGLQAGAQEFAQAMFLSTPKALEYLDSSAGLSVGLGPSIVVVDKGMAKDLSTTAARSDVYVFIYSQHGLMGASACKARKLPGCVIDCSSRSRSGPRWGK